MQQWLCAYLNGNLLKGQNVIPGLPELFNELVAAYDD
jgi:hypothetical protein